jgi:DNA-binding CsgD family transcriptional regulator
VKDRTGIGWTLVTYGAPPGAIVAAVLGYWVILFWLTLLVGAVTFWSLRRSLNRRQGLQQAQHHLAKRAVRRGQPLATGERARKRTVETRVDLAPQEAPIARLARGGLSNAEIGERLFVSPRTVEYPCTKSSASSISARANRSAVSGWRR